MKATSILVITTPDLIDNGRASFKFISSVPNTDPAYRRMSDFFDNWGHVRLVPKGDDHFDPWEWAKMQRGENHGRIVGDDGTPRLNVNIWASGGGRHPMLSLGYDYNPAEQQEDDPMRKFTDDLPEGTMLLMPRHLFDHFEAACKASGVEVVAYHHPEPIPTS